LVSGGVNGPAVKLLGGVTVEDLSLSVFESGIEPNTGKQLLDCIAWTIVVRAGSWQEATVGSWQEATVRSWQEATVRSWQEATVRC
jgi:hypothetical protein